METQLSNVFMNAKEHSVQIMVKVGSCQKRGEVKYVGKSFIVILCSFHLSRPNTSSLWGIFVHPDCIVGLQTKH